MPRPLDAQPGQNITLTYSGKPPGTTELFAAFFNGILPTFVPLDGGYSATIAQVAWPCRCRGRLVHSSQPQVIRLFI
ncbi:hypothetical protein BJV78DRAFT_112533 [Lactifluus subvellereus]|nr:hypothetical protein BJV78DRAFT_112533 [Lactifluus subvellereus]